MSFLATLAIIFGTLGALGNAPQAFKIFMRKSAKDISIIAYIIFSIGSTIWILYGIELGNSALIISNSIGLFFQVLVIIGWLKYGRI
jgi:MtN3 and saliva related transmembrane protein